MNGRLTGSRRIAAAALAAALLLSGVEGAFGANSGQIAQQLKELKNDVRRAGAAYERAYWRVDESEVRLKKLDKQIAKTNRELAAARKRLSKRVGLMYRAGGLSYMTVVLGASSFDDMVSRLDFMQRVGRSDAFTISDVESLQLKLSKQRAEVGSETKRKRKALSSLRAERDKLKRRMGAKQQQFERLVGQSGGSFRSLPRGPLGMVFPVAGVSYYSDTWGASRSGGRRSHKGTDIMAAHGTPVVAVLDGTVSSRTGGLGGRCIYLNANNGWQFYYAHLSGYAVTSGRVNRGDIIGWVGSTGNASSGSPHLHFEIHPGGGGAVNPYPYLRAID
ncbi:MAG: hypothetical protein C0418_03310 [Coriobacteriaceae bacterium]|nr:hypothetical protein [Coriobacteriaceae bacterium]